MTLKTRLGLIGLLVSAISAQGRIAYEAAPLKGFGLRVRDASGNPLPARTLAVRFVPGANQVVAANQNGLSLWDLGTRKAVWTVELPDTRTTEVTADGKWVFVLGGKPFLKIQARRTSDGSLYGEIPMASFSKGTPFGAPSATGGLAYFRDDYKAVEWMTFEPGEFLEVAIYRRFMLPAIERVASLAFTPSGDRMAVSGIDQILVVDTNTEKVLSTIASGEGSGDVAFSPDGTLLASSGVFRAPGVRLWDTVTGAALADLAPKGSPSANRVLFTPDGAYLFAAGAMGGAQTAIYSQIFDVAAKKPVASAFRPIGLPPLPESHLRVSDMQFSPDGKSLALGLYHGGGGDGTPFTIPSVYVVPFAEVP